MSEWVFGFDDTLSTAYRLLPTVLEVIKERLSAFKLKVFQDRGFHIDAEIILLEPAERYPP